MKIFVVTSGEYSDYSISAMFSTKKLAQTYIDKRKLAEEWDDDGYDIEEWIVDQQATAKVLMIWRCGILLESGEIKEKPVRPYNNLEAPFRGRVCQTATAIPIYGDALMIRVESTVSAKHCEKLAVEERQKWLRQKAATT